MVVGDGDGEQSAAESRMFREGEKVRLTNQFRVKDKGKGAARVEWQRERKETRRLPFSHVLNFT